MTAGADAWLALADWRRRVAELYAEVRAVLHADGAAAHTRWREGREQLFATHPQSPSVAPLRHFPYDPAFAVSGRVTPVPDPDRWPVATSQTTTIDFLRVGTVTLTGAGAAWGTLDLFWLDAYGGGLFLPFRDATCGERTYGGGRYLLDTAKGADLGSTPSGDLVLDFNFAYHPSCYHDAAWSCPLAPPGNHLDVAVTAGESRRLDEGGAQRRPLT